MDEEIHVLVNNVSICYPKERPEYFTEIPNLSQFIESIINVNIKACTRLTALVLPRMVAKGRGVIINLSSMSALYPIPLLAIYSATKVYIDYLSRCLHQEYKSKGIVIQSLMSTNMSHNMTPAHDLVESVLKMWVGSRELLHTFGNDYSFITIISTAFGRRP
ncbi:unnamed protein product [Oppiella nova]|uniref:Uncharacterized protein n=1 Tax=Oppiella nova TaxID=334625 RepID=A0A7R9QVX2_9ACAR|nr:unnamed protein product [Oppiella nova]CAG2177005.1 unnamed protein product [Oppiella nova]